MRVKLKAGFLVKVVLVAVIGIGALFSAGCVPKVARPEMLTAPKPQPDATLEYLSPYTTDGVMCEWTDKMANVSLASKVGGTVAAIAAQQVMKNIPIAGAFLGLLADRAGEAIGRKMAIESVGGMEYIQSKSDQSFATAEELALHMYTTYCYNEHYNASLGAMMDLYPELKRENRYSMVLVEASKNICANNPACVNINELPNICGIGNQMAQKPANDTLQSQEPVAAVIEPAQSADKLEKSAAEKNITPAK